MNRSPNSEERAEQKKNRLKNRIDLRMSVALIIVILALFLLLLKVYFIQRDNAEEYNKIVLNQRQSEYMSQTIPARRGDIYDRNGNRLATSEKVYILILDPKQMISAESRKPDGTRSRNVVETTLKEVSEFFDLDYPELSTLITNNENSSYIRVAKDISYDRKQEFLAYQKEKNAAYGESDNAEERKKKIAGVWFEDNYKRNYPYGSLACSVIGFSNGEGTGGTGGVEQYYNDLLTGIPGREYGYLDDDADLEKVVKSAENGKTLVLTIDAEIQTAAEKYLQEWADGEIGSKSAACIVMNPNNGEILAMASTSSFDLNDPVTPGRYTEEEVYAFGLKEAAAKYRTENPEKTPITEEEVPAHYSTEEIMNLGTVNAAYRTWRNICVSDTYEPGSTQKIFTVAGALEEGIIHPEDTFECEGHVQLSDGVNSWRINCVNRNGHGLLDVTGGITNSCNVVMMDIAFEEGSETFMKYEKIFGFGDLTGIDLPAETNTLKLGFESDSIGRTQLATNAFGQNYNCTMVQMAAAYASVINGGSYYQPHVVRQILASDGTLIKDVNAELVRETVSASTCNYLKNALYETVNSGTGKAAAVEGYTVGGKTGTAQKLPRSAETYVVSFCGFAPVENPKLLCYVIVDEPNLPGQEAAHSSFASEIFSKIMADSLPVMGIYPEGTNASEYVAPAGRTNKNEPAVPGGTGDSSSRGEGNRDGSSSDAGNGNAGNGDGSSSGGQEKLPETAPETVPEHSTEERQNEEQETVPEIIPETAPVNIIHETDEFIQGDDGGGFIPEVIFGVAPGE